MNISAKNIETVLQEFSQQTNALLQGEHGQALLSEIQHRMKIDRDVDLVTVVAQTMWDWRERK